MTKETILNGDTTALVTGASAGIGKAVAVALSAQGVRVICTARRVDRLNAL
ncbi:MAG: SDR family NAD(P)-dependent oxidoreductase, partial [Rhodospirillaceae bacterium]|nr:SDR family NAD(P)-dependent oxidoreductase [Rhodospirillaceae bacterium]